MLRDFWHRLRLPIGFYLKHHRWPSRSRMALNDVLYRIKMGDEILNPLRQFVSDKEFVKIFVRAQAGDHYNVPTIKVLRSMEEVRAYDFPADCVIKATHTSSRGIFRRAGSEIDFDQIQSWFHENYYTRTYERNYKYLQPKVIVEPYIFNSQPDDYKFFCSHGKCRVMFITEYTERGKFATFFDRDGAVLPFRVVDQMHDVPPEMPANLPEMFELAEKLSEPFNFIRVDLYSNGQEILVGELTNVHSNLREKFVPRSSELDHAHYFFPDGENIATR